HPAPLGCFRSEPLHQVYTLIICVKTEQIARIAVYAVSHPFRRIPKYLPPIVRHAPRLRRIISPEVVQPQIGVQLRHGSAAGIITENKAVCYREIDLSIRWIYKERPA